MPRFLTHFVSVCTALNRSRDQCALARVNIAIPHCVNDAIDTIFEKLTAGTQSFSHIVYLSPVPLFLIRFAKLPHVLALSVSSRHDAPTKAPPPARVDLCNARTPSARRVALS
jgi:hypothetical protein